MMQKLSSRSSAIWGIRPLAASRAPKSVLFGILVVCAASCGGKVVVDAPGAGGAGGTGQGGSGLSSSNTSGSSSSSASSSSGEPSPCDLTSSCETCVNCTVGIVCSEQWEKCAANQQCLDLMYCLATCQNEQPCIDKCLAVFPGGIEAYNETALCVVCQACANDCEGLTQNCP